MAGSVNRNGFPKSGNFLSFLKTFSLLDPSQQGNVFISRAAEPGNFNFCVFPSAVNLPAESKRFIRVAEEVAAIMSEASRPSSVNQAPKQM